MLQIYGMKRPGGTVKHIVQIEHKPPKYSRRFALCGTPVETMDLADTIGGTCQRCLNHPKFNDMEQE
jgi:hypothetical protein